MIKLAFAAIVTSSVVTIGFAELIHVEVESSATVKAKRPVEDKTVSPDPNGGIDPLPKEATVPVDVVICLDTSGSMTALIDSARAQLWEVVNEFSRAKPRPVLRVGLLTYGSPAGTSKENGWVVRQVGLTTDLDAVYAKMMSLGTSGGDEFVGWVLNDAVRTMDWSKDPRALRIVYVAGNESADQAANVFNFRSICTEARERDILVNAIYAGNHMNGINEKWNELALYGQGEYAAIDMNAGLKQIHTKHDDILIKLNAELNATYIPYGTKGVSYHKRQAEQDAQAEEMGPQTAASRAAAKATAMYTNSHWDLVDASADDAVDVRTLPQSELPAPMQTMTPEQRIQYVDQLKTRRQNLQKKIKEVQAARETELRDRRAKANDKDSLGSAARRSIRKQAAKKSIVIE